MKKLLGISLVAVLAVSPLMARAEVVSADPSNVAGASAQATNAPAYPLAESAATDRNAASAGYVKGAYNAAIKAVNRVASDLTTNLTMTEGAGIDITNNKVSVDLTANGGLGLTGEGDAATLGVKVDNTTIDLDATGQVKIKDGVQGTSTAGYADSKALTTKGYVDEGLAGKQATLSQGNAISIQNNTVSVSGLTTSEIASGSMATSSTAGAVNNQLATKGYVDDVNARITDLGNVATQEGVEATIKNTGITVADNKTVSLSGTVTGTDAGTIIVMTDWTDPTQTTTHNYIGGVSNNLNVALGGTITADINDATVSYSETVTQPGA